MPKKSYVRTVKGTGPNILVREDNVGSANKGICYPGISSCISITGVSSLGLVGCHITIGTSLEEIDEMFTAMKLGGGSGCAFFYVIGRFGEFKPHGKNKEFNTRKKIQARIKAKISKNANVKFYDTSNHGETHVIVEKQLAKTNCYWIKAAGNTVSNTYPAFANETEIKTFQTR